MARNLHFPPVIDLELTWRPRWGHAETKVAFFRVYQISRRQDLLIVTKLWWDKKLASMKELHHPLVWI